jgi:hypothetical protein
MTSDTPRPPLELFDRRLWRRHYFIPTEHGAWIWWIGPFLIGAAAGGKPGLDALVLLWLSRRSSCATRRRSPSRP